MAGNPVTYAEVDLGVHATYESAKRSLDRIEELDDQISGLRGLKRNGEEMVAEAEYRVTADVWSDSSYTSQAARDKAIKLALAADDATVTARAGVRMLADQIETLESARSVERIRAEIEIARMNELGGYLAYLAAAKSSRRS